MPPGKSDAELADDFKNFLLNKIHKIRQQFMGTYAYSSEPSDASRLRRFQPFTESQVKNIISSMQSKSCELYAIPIHMLKGPIDKCLPDNTKIVNISLTEGIFSDKWKVAIVRPLLKKAGPVLINKNYQPVSNLFFLSKLMEKCALTQFNAHCDQYNLLPDFQSAYHKGYSNETSLIKLTNDILWGIENQEITMVVLLDLSAAFDTVDHDFLLSIFRNRFGITDIALNWYNTYLQPRQMKVCGNNSYSEELNLKYGVPQGSCSGGNNFVAYCSPIEEIINKPIQTNGYADDHSLHHKFNPNSSHEEIDTVADLQLSVKNIAN